MNKFIERFKIKFYELWYDVDEEISWRFLLWITHRWSNKHLDQWTKFTLQSEYGPVYVGLATIHGWIGKIPIRRIVDYEIEPDKFRAGYPDSYDDYIE